MLEMFQVEVKMADHEYESASLRMDDLAREQFTIHHDKMEHLMVTVNEHAGWFLSYAMVDGIMVIVETANDAATVTPERRQFWSRINNCEHKWNRLPTVNRNKTPT